MFVPLVAMILLALILGGLWFHRSVLAVRGRLHNEWERGLLRSFARGVATVAAHRLHFFELHWRSPADRGTLKEILTRDLDRFPESQTWSLDLGTPPPPFRQTPPEPDDDGPDEPPSPADLHLRPVLEPLENCLRAQGRLDYQVQYSVGKADFRPLHNGLLPGEKAGFLRVTVTSTFRDITEDFHFAFAVKVAAAVVPRLSKFDLFLGEGAFAQDTDVDEFRFNLVRNNADGEILPSSEFVPLVLDNGVRLSGSRITLDHLVADPIGFVYLGGKDSLLNLSRGESRQGRYGEAFHLFEERDGNDWNGWVTHGEDFGLQFQSWEKGIQDWDSPPGNEEDWWRTAITLGRQERLFNRSSCFRLFGTDKGGPSPTLVFGRVSGVAYALKACVAVENPDVPNEVLFQVRETPSAVWQDCISDFPEDAANWGLPCIATLAQTLFGHRAPSSCKVFNRTYASTGSFFGYNRALGFLADPGKPDPRYDQALQNLVQRENWLPGRDPPSQLRVLLPRGESSGEGSLPEVAAYLRDMGIPGGREAWKIDLAGEEEDLLKVLKRKGLLRHEDKLDLRGWVMLTGSAGTGPSAAPTGRSVVRFDRPLFLLSDGGIVLDHGDIVVNGEIRTRHEEGRDRNRFLTLVALDGDIEIQAGQQPLDVVLVANGQIRIRGMDDRVTTIRGSLAMKRLDKDSLKHPVVVEYQPRLAILPGQPARAEVLGISTDPNPVNLP
ncbi:MAG: hypothetical protein GX442_06805 [Candidatus Riflebacteria bacterium]|nr:hypothetical protein [Candidatus Riflebacteria bacterium]